MWNLALFDPKESDRVAQQTFQKSSFKKTSAQNVEILRSDESARDFENSKISKSSIKGLIPEEYEGSSQSSLKQVSFSKSHKIIEFPTPGLIRETSIKLKDYSKNISLDEKQDFTIDENVQKTPRTVLNSDNLRDSMDSEALYSVTELKIDKKMPTSRVKQVRAQTEVQQDPDDEKQMKALIRKELSATIESERLPKDSIYVQVYKDYVNSHHFKTTVKKRRLKELAKLNVKPEGYTEIHYDSKYHSKKLVGLFSRQYEPSFFEVPATKAFIDLLNDIYEQLLPHYSLKQFCEFASLLQSSSNQLIVLFDERKQKDIPSSRNRQKVLKNMSEPKPVMIGFAVFQKTNSFDPSSMFVHQVYGKYRKRQYKKKVLLALKNTQDQFRVHQMLIQVSKKDRHFYKDQDFTPTDFNQESLSQIGVEKRSKGIPMLFVTFHKDRDIKLAIEEIEQTELRNKAKKLKKGIEGYRNWLKQNIAKLMKSINKKNKRWALPSDQAKTPKWLMNKIKRFCRITNQHIKDVFIFRENWNADAFYDGFAEVWDEEVFHYINSPFSQIINALKKCADFQASGGNCAMILPTICIEDCPLYDDALKHCTIRVDLPLFAFGGFKYPLMKHIVLLYFLQPEFANALTIKKEQKVLEVCVVQNPDQTKLKIMHLPAPKRNGAKKNELNEIEKEFISDNYRSGRTINYIRIKLRRRGELVRKFLNHEFGEAKIRSEQDARMKGKRSDSKKELLKKIKA